MKTRNAIGNPILKYLGVVFIYTVLMIFVLGNNFYNIITIYENNIKNSIEHTITEYDELDLEHLCILSNCTQIGFLNNNANYNSTNFHLVKNTNSSDLKALKYYDRLRNFPKILHLINILANENTHFKTLIKIPHYNLYVVNNSSIMIKKLLINYLWLYFIFLILLTILTIFYLYKLRLKTEIDRMTTSGILREKNMQILTENIHHELNTPVAILEGNIRKMEKLAQKQNKKSKICNPTCELTSSFEQIDFGLFYSNIDQINTVLERMSNFKNLRYSNGDKTLYDILKYSANSMTIYKAVKFEILIDPAFKNWGLKHGTKYLRNEDLLNIISNHLRNSIEASSTVIELQLKITNKSFYNAHIFIIDNGNGLRDAETGLLLSPSKYQNIFKDYYSSKNKQGQSKVLKSKGLIKDTIATIKIKFKNIFKFKNLKKESKEENHRGVGLYLNKELLKDNHGDLKLRETSANGTVFEIMVPVVKFNK